MISILTCVYFSDGLGVQPPFQKQHLRSTAFVAFFVRCTAVPGRSRWIFFGFQRASWRHRGWEADVTGTTGSARQCAARRYGRDSATSLDLHLKNPAGPKKTEMDVFLWSFFCDKVDGYEYVYVSESKVGSFQPTRVSQGAEFKNIMNILRDFCWLPLKRWKPVKTMEIRKIFRENSYPRWQWLDSPRSRRSPGFQVAEM